MSMALRPRSKDLNNALKTKPREKDNSEYTNLTIDLHVRTAARQMFPGNVVIKGNTPLATAVTDPDRFCHSIVDITIALIRTTFAVVIPLFRSNGQTNQQFQTAGYQ
ncbi:hypothetical protein NHQ30_001773 [Ciborinia camelliae]|nr:hypothetical protein NHQ30_001773 [Ciborinia camelliae]